MPAFLSNIMACPTVPRTSDSIVHQIAHCICTSLSDNDINSPHPRPQSSSQTPVLNPVLISALIPKPAHNRSTKSLNKFDYIKPTQTTHPPTARNIVSYGIVFSYFLWYSMNKIMNNEKTKFVHIEVSKAESERKFEEMFVSIIYSVRLKLSAHLGAQYVQIL